jgi:hypothetical protein
MPLCLSIMKTKLFLFLLLSFVFGLLSSQIPQGINYQAVVHNSSGAPVSNATIQVKMSILSDTIIPVVMYEELHSVVKTNINGIFNLVIGDGTWQSGSAITFSSINWSVTPLFLKTSIYYQNAWKYLGTSKLWSVPYSMVAGELAGSVKKLAVVGETSGLEEALFEVRNKDGQIVFAVYNEGVRVYVSDGAKAVKGGFAVGGFGTDKQESQKYLVVSRDSTRIYIDTDTLTKKTKGGFAVGGYDLTKLAAEEYLRITRDSTRIYVNETPGKGIKGGFAVGGFDITKGMSSTPFTSLTPLNYFIGHNSGIHNTTGKYNSFVGYETGYSNSSGKRNVFLGFHAGYSNDTASYNVFIGNEAGNSNKYGRFNTFLGFQSGYKNFSASNNLFLGYQSGYSNVNGTSNVFLGVESGRSNINGSNNVFMGYLSGYANNAYSNVFIGEESGRSNTSGSNNNFIGYKSGWSNTSGGSNIFVGTQSGYLNTTGDMNTFFGYQAGYKNNNSYNFIAGYQAGYNNTGNYNSFIGFLAGYTNTAGSSNVFIGERAAYSNTTGNYNIVIGESAGRAHNNGYSNVLIGPECGYSITDGRDNTFIGGWTGYNNTGSYNIMIGSQSGYGNIIGTNNTFLGFSAGRNNNGSRNVFVGYNAGYNEAGSDKLYIDNSAASTPLIWGDFSLGRLVVRGNSLDNPNNRTFYANGTAGGDYAWYNDSDMKLKHNIVTITDALQKVMKLRGVNYMWNEPEEGMEGLQMGFIGQEAAEVIPEVVSVNNDHYSMQYAPVTALLVEAVKEQQNIIESQQQQIDELKDLVNKLLSGK